MPELHNLVEFATLANKCIGLVTLAADRLQLRLKLLNIIASEAGLQPSPVCASDSAQDADARIATLLNTVIDTIRAPRAN